MPAYKRYHTFYFSIRHRLVAFWICKGRGQYAYKWYHTFFFSIRQHPVACSHVQVQGPACRGRALFVKQAQPHLRTYTYLLFIFSAARQCMSVICVSWQCHYSARLQGAHRGIETSHYRLSSSCACISLGDWLGFAVETLQGR